MKRATGDPRRAFGYVRASTEEQRNTLEAQRAELVAHAAAKGLELVQVFEEQVSGAAELADRPQIMAAVAALRAQRIGLLLVTKRDRLARDVIAAATLESLAKRQGARIVSLAGEGSELEGAQGEMIRTILDAVAAYERAMIGARTKAVVAHRAAQGMVTGTPHYGYRVGPGGRIEEHPEEMKVVRYCREQRAKGQKYERILELCHARGFTTRKGTRLTRTNIARFCTRPLLKITPSPQAA